MNNKKSIIGLFLLFVVILLSVGYAQIGSISLGLKGTVSAKAQEGIFITHVNTNGDENASVNYSGSLLHSAVTLPAISNDSSALPEVSYTISFYNNSTSPQIYNGTIVDKTDEYVYSNQGIDYRVEGIEIGEVITAKEFDITLTFFYKDGIIDNNVLESWLKFNFISAQWEFDYKEEEKERVFIVPKSGYYELNVWGAQGESGYGVGGYGGYSTGTVYLEKGTQLYINIGQSPTDGAGGYNGGGAASGTGNGGGGATHIALVSGELSELEQYKGTLYADGLTYKSEKILIVAGGGGGSDNWRSNLLGSSAGGYLGNNINITGQIKTDIGGATQTSGGDPYYEDNYISTAGIFGQGGNGSDRYGGGGGGGFYGGGGGGATADVTASGGGGSGYIGYYNILNAHMTCYDCNESSSERINTTSSLFASSEPYVDTPKIGNGYAKIKYIDNLDVLNSREFAYSAKEQVVTINKAGYYKLEVWGAQGGSTSGLTGGYGGYSSGNIHLEEGTTLYINVGGTTDDISGGYNGGGSAKGTGYGGGGATHIALESGELSTLKTEEGTIKLSSLLIVAGGGGGADSWYNGAIGGSAGGYIGVPGSLTGKTVPYEYGGGTQSSGGLPYYQGQYESTAGAFGLGGNGSISTGYGGAGGGGLYGGGGGGAASNWCAGGSGGSGYIANLLPNTRVMYCYNCTEPSKDDSIYDSIKTISTDNVDSSPVSNSAKMGTGYARITLISSDND